MEATPAAQVVVVAVPAKVTGDPTVEPASGLVTATVPNAEAAKSATMPGQKRRERYLLIKTGSPEILRNALNAISRFEQCGLTRREHSRANPHFNAKTSDSQV